MSYGARVLRAGRVTLPMAMRRELDLRPGDEIAFDLRKKWHFQIIRHRPPTTETPRRSARLG